MTATAFDAGMAVAAHLNNQTIARTKTPLVSIRKTGIFEIDKADAAKVKEKVSERPSDRATKRSIFIYFFNEIIK